MLNSKTHKQLLPYIDIINKHRGISFREIFEELGTGKHSTFKKGANGLIVENLLGLSNNNSKKADLEDLKVEIKVLPVQLSTNKPKEPTQIKMINYLKVAKETWETAEVREKIETIFWVVYGVRKENKKNVTLDKYILLDWFIDIPDMKTQDIFQKDWESIKEYIVKGDADMLSCSMGYYIEPKTKGKNNRDLTNAPDGKGGTKKVRRRAFYFKKRYTKEMIIDKLDIPENV